MALPVAGESVYHAQTYKRLPEPPFVVNYQGAIFRQYPGPFQCLLDTGKAFGPSPRQGPLPSSRRSRWR